MGLAQLLERACGELSRKLLLSPLISTQSYSPSLEECSLTIHLRSSSKYPLYSGFTLKIFAARIYVICEPSLIQAAYRNTKAFDFTTFVVDSSKRAFNIGEDGMKIIRGETSPDYDPKGPFLNGNNGTSYLNENHRLMVEYLGPGGSLLELNKGVLGSVADILNKLDQNSEKVSLYRWMRDTLTLATSASLYGPHDPVSADHSLIDSLWLAILSPARVQLSVLNHFYVPNGFSIFYCILCFHFYWNTG